MLMRYEWGLGIGHTYSWENKKTAGGICINSPDIEDPEPELDERANDDPLPSSAGAEDSDDERDEDYLDDMENELLSGDESDRDRDDGHANGDEEESSDDDE